MTLRLGGDGAITGCTSLENPDLTVSGLTISGSFDAEKVLVASGTAAAPSYTFSGDTDNGLYYAGTNSIGLSAGGTNAILIDSTGSVGIGTTSPAQKFHVYDGRLRVQSNTSDTTTDLRLFELLTGSTGGSQFYIRAENSADDNSNWEIKTNASEELKFTIGTGEAFRLDTSRRLLIGTSSARTNVLTYLLAPALQVEGTTGDTSRLLAVRNANSAGSEASLILAKSRGTSNSSNTIVQADDSIGVVEFAGADGTNLISGCSVGGEVDGTPGSASMPGRLVFNTTSVGDDVPTERMRIDSSGNVGIGNSNPAAGASGGSNRILNIASGITSGVSHITFGDSNAAGKIESVNGNGTIAINGASAVTIGTSGSSTERMRIDSNGQISLKAGTNDNGMLGWNAAADNFTPGGGNITPQYGIARGSAGNNTLGVSGYSGISFYTSATSRMAINAGGAIFAYNLSGSASAGAALKLISDQIYRDTSSIQFKKDVEDIEESYATNLLENARPTWFRAKEDENPEHSYYGFIAEELAEVEPRLCVFENDEPFSVDYAKFTPLLLKLLQMQNAHIKSLETQLEALEQRLTDAGL